jgi:hypothetical protein
MPLPSINIEFKETGITAIQRGERGVVMLILDDVTELGMHEVVLLDEIPAGLSDKNQEYVKQALTGYVNAPLSVKLYVADITGGSTTLSEILGDLEMVKFDYLAYPDADDDTGTDSNDIYLQVKSWRDNLGKKVKAILANTNADYPGVINFTTDGIEVNGTTYTAKEYTPRIAGLLAGTPLTISATFAPLPEVDRVPLLTKTEIDDAIDAGEFKIYHDGEKVKVARAVNSFVTTTQDKGSEWKKIKIVDILDLWYTDIRTTAEDSYIGKYANSYDNKVLLVNAINGYNEQLEMDGLLKEDGEVESNTVMIDVEAQRIFLQSQGMDVSTWSEQQIKEANTDDQVFIKVNLSPLDAMEDINLRVFL